MARMNKTVILSLAGAAAAAGALGFSQGGQPAALTRGPRRSDHRWIARAGVRVGP